MIGLLELIDAGADDISAEDDGVVISTAPDMVAKARDAAEKLGFKVESFGLEWVAKDSKVPESESDRKKIEGFFEALDDDEDVNAIYSTVDL